MARITPELGASVVSEEQAASPVRGSSLPPASSSPVSWAPCSPPAEGAELLVGVETRPRDPRQPRLPPPGRSPCHRPLIQDRVGSDSACSSAGSKPVPVLPCYREPSASRHRGLLVRRGHFLGTDRTSFSLRGWNSEGDGRGQPSCYVAEGVGAGWSPLGDTCRGALCIALV